MVQNLRHMGIVVSDVEKALDFYVGLLGLKIKRDMWEEGPYIDNFSDLKNVLVRTIKMEVGDSGGMIELLYYKSHPEFPNPAPISKIGASHPAFTVGNLDETYEKMVSNNVSFNAPPQLSPDGKAKVTFCKDPDGTLVELVEELR